LSVQSPRKPVCLDSAGFKPKLALNGNNVSCKEKMVNVERGWKIGCCEKLNMLKTRLNVKIYY